MFKFEKTINIDLDLDNKENIAKYILDCLNVKNYNLENGSICDVYTTLDIDSVYDFETYTIPYLEQYAELYLLSKNKENKYNFDKIEFFNYSSTSILATIPNDTGTFYIKKIKPNDIIIAKQ